MKTIKLYNGIEMPLLGYGLYKVGTDECEKCVSEAIKAGYRLIDTAEFYENEEGVGAAIAKSGIPREEFFVVTKVWINNSGEEKAYASVKRSLKKLGTGYADLILVHQPFGDYYGTYRALERAMEEGLTRAIGVSNFRPDRYYDLVQHCKIIPMVNQLEANVLSQQTEIREVMKEYGTKVMAWGPVAQGKADIIENKALEELGKKYGKSAAQIGLRFLTQEGIAAIPKSSNPERIAANIDIFDFELNEEEMTVLRAMNATDAGTRDYSYLPYVSKLIGQKVL